MAAIMNYFADMSAYMLAAAAIYLVIRVIYFKKSKKKPDLTKEISTTLLIALAVGILSQTVFPQINFGVGDGFYLNFSGLVLGYENGGFFYELMPDAERSLNLVPFKTICAFLFSEGNAYLPKDVLNTRRVINLLGNVFLFVPLGFLLPLSYKKAEKFGIMFLIGSAYVLFIEITQHFIYRISDIDDYILNMLGIMLGFGIYKIFKKLFINKKLSAN